MLATQSLLLCIPSHGTVRVPKGCTARRMLLCGKVPNTSQLHRVLLLVSAQVRQQRDDARPRASLQTHATQTVEDSSTHAPAYKKSTRGCGQGEGLMSGEITRGPL
ncbi:unnamed protein product [Eretmochelys imbricata]